MIRKERLISTLLAIMLMLSMVLDTVSCIPMHLHTHHADSSTTPETSTTDVYVDAPNTTGWGDAQKALLSYFETNSEGKYRVKDGKQLVVNESHFYYTDETTGEKHVVGTNEATVIFPGGIIYNDGAIVTCNVCTDAQHDISNTANTNLSYERNTDTHIVVCSACGFMKSSPHNYPTVRIGVEESGSWYNRKYYIKLDGAYNSSGVYQGGKYINKETGAEQDNTINALTLEDLQNDNSI
ncbi:MAG: hypothetical protein IJW61_02190, partial [Clostridia bacterium]|nr:hypothetical protein [Clostridia bacterium]